MIKNDDELDELNARLASLLDSIMRISGDKIVTLVTYEEEAPFVIDINADGAIGYEKSHEALFKSKLVSALIADGAVLTIRQFLSLKVEREMPTGKKVWIPRKNIYGIRIVNGRWEFLSKEEMRSAHCTDAETGQPIPQEKDVSFVDFPA